MLIFNPSLMRGMSVDHLLNALELEPEFMRTSVELELIKRIRQIEDERDERLDRDDVADKIREVTGLFPNEDFLCELSNRVYELGEKLTGDDQTEAFAIASALSKLESDVMEGIDSAVTKLDEVTS